MEIVDELSKYSKKEINFILALLQNGNISKSAKISGISEMTAHKWLKNRFKRWNIQIKKNLHRK